MTEAPEVEEYLKKFPIWVDYHIKEVLFLLNGATPEQKERVLKEEDEKLKRFCELLCNTEMNHQEAEAEVYGKEELEAFYSELEELREERNRPPEPQYVPTEKEESQNFYLEEGLSKDRKNELLAWGYLRLKISPYGKSGAAFYWVKPRYNEGAEHAFFCYLIEQELKTHIKEVRLNVTGGPDVEFEHDKKKYCFEVETSLNLSRNRERIERRFKRYKEYYEKVFILVTRKKLRGKYSRLGIVITRSGLQKAVYELFSSSHTQHNK